MDEWQVAVALCAQAELEIYTAIFYRTADAKFATTDYLSHPACEALMGASCELNY